MSTFPDAGANRPGTGAVGLWLPVILYAAGIFAFSSMEQPPAPPGGPPDYVVHALLFAGFAAVILRALARARWSGVSTGSAFGAAAAATLYGATDEFHQMFVPGRTPSLVDLGADAVGAILAVSGALLVSRFAWVRLSRPSRSSP